MHAKEDAEKKEKIEARNMADSLIFTSEKSLKDAGDKVTADLKKEVEDKIAELKKILDTGTKEELEAKTKELSDSLQKVGQAMSQQPQGQPGAQEPKTEEKTEDKKEEPKSDKEEPVEGEVVN